MELSILDAAFRDSRIAFRIHHNKLFYRDPLGLLAHDELDSIRDCQDRLIERLALRMTPQVTNVNAALARRRRVPLAFQQESALLYREPSFYTLHAIRMRGPLDVNALSQSLATVINRHSALRSTIIVVDGALMQEIGESAVLNFHIDSAEAPKGSDLESQVDETINSFVAGWLSGGSLTFDVRLIRLGEADHVMVVAWDHLFSDFTSEKIVFKEIWIAYRDLLKQRSQTLSKLPMQYFEYVMRQRNDDTQSLKANETFWQERLAGAVNLQLRPDPGHRELKSIQDRFFHFSLGISLSRGVHDLARSERTLPSLVVFTACVSLLSIWSGQREFLIPFYVYGRHSSRQLEVVGYLAHPLPLRIKLDGDEAFLDLLRRVFDEFLLASQHLTTGKSLPEAPNPFKSPFVQWFDSPPDPCGSLVPTWGDVSSNDIRLSIEAFPLRFPRPQEPSVMDQVPLTLTLWNSAQGITGEGVYRTDLFTYETIHTFISDLRSALEAAVSNRQISVATFGSRR